MKGLPRYPILYTRAQVTDLIIDRDEEISKLKEEVKDLRSFEKTAAKLATRGITSLNDGVHADILRTIFSDIATNARRSRR